MIYKSKLQQPIPWNPQLFVVLHLTSFYHDEVDIFVQHHRARQVQLVGVGLHFKLLSGILQVPNPSREKAMCCNQAGLTSSSNCRTCSPFTNTHLYTAMWTPSVRSSFSFFTFFSFRCSAVSLRAALASSWALWTEDAARRSQSYEPGAFRSREEETETRLFGTYFCLLAICARTCASTFVGSWTASVPSTLIRLEMRTGGECKHQLRWSKMAVALIWAYL